MAGRSTPATIAAEQASIPFSVHEYEHDPKADSYGLEAAERLGVDAARVLKTLVAAVDGKLTVCVVPVGLQLDLKAAARAAGGRKAAIAPAQEAERATGYVVGGISPLGQRRPLPTLLDASALDHQTVFVSGGRRGLELELAPADLARITAAVSAPIAR